MANFFDRFRDPEKVKAREEEEAKRREAARVAAQEEEQRARAEETARRIREEEAIANSLWEYSENVDEMRGTTKSLAQIISENSVEFDFPYNGGCKAILMLRKTGNFREVLFVVTNGQFNGDLQSYTIATKFDQGPVTNRIATPPDSGAHDVMFISNEVDFIREISRSDKLIIEADFYQSGRRQFTFMVGGLDRRFR